MKKQTIFIDGNDFSPVIKGKDSIGIFINWGEYLLVESGKELAYYSEGGGSTPRHEIGIYEIGTIIKTKNKEGKIKKFKLTESGWAEI